MSRDIWLTQPYINSVPYIYKANNLIEYNEETGVYTITSNTDDFKILQLTDIHLGGSILSYDKDLKALETVYKLIDYTKPNLVIVTGDLTFPKGVNSKKIKKGDIIMRDKLKDKDYFEAFLLDKNKEISEIEALIENLPEENKAGLRNGQGFLQQFYREKLMAMYSNGTSVADLKEPFFKMLNYAEHTINADLGNFKTTEILALAVLLDIVDDRLFVIAKKSEENEKLFDIFLQYLNSNWSTNSSETIYDSLLEAAYSDTPEENLCMYLNKKWYKEHRDADWYNSARSKYNTYCGYWAMEVAALVKILNISDDILKTCSYYPYDMVHFQKLHTE